MESTEQLVKKIAFLQTENPADLLSLKRNWAREQGVACPRNSALLKAYHTLIGKGKLAENDRLKALFRTKSVRSLSGIVSVSVLTKPYPCPGSCLYCPAQKGLPKSYLRGEPAVMRALAHNFNPYAQVSSRLAALEATGHRSNKIELIVIGGTWSFLSPNYQNWFIEECFRAANQTSAKLGLEKQQKINEKARRRLVGITIETRPDFINKKEVRRLRQLGVTRVELGVQSLDDDILKKNRRGHLVEQTIRATRLLKNAGFKVCYHMMLGLPGSSMRKDRESFRRLFRESDFQPDFLKIYPCVVVKEAPLYRLWREKQYRPMTNRQLVSLLTAIKAEIPPYCRVIRIYRDIPSSQIVAGSKVSNLRQVVKKKLEAQGKKCWCIRCRQPQEDTALPRQTKLFRQDYGGSQEREIFLSFEDKNRRQIYSLLRLRIPGEKPVLVFPVLRGAALIREVHTYGRLLDFGQRQKNAAQHQSLGRELIRKAEEIAKKEFGLKKIAVISGVGARNYYRRLGYRLKDTYLIKRL